MGATTPTVTFESSNGQIIAMCAYCAGGDAIGTVIPIQAQGTATANSPSSFQLPPGTWTLRYISGPATGVLRLWCNGSPGPIAYNLATVIAQVASGLRAGGAFKGGSQYNYSFVVDTALAA